jgi:O-methyltransferase involved in polyketide biosynthesis
MDELPAQRDAVEQDADAPLARDRFARELGDEWQQAEPGIYRFVGPTRSGRDSGLDGDAFE